MIEFKGELTGQSKEYVLKMSRKNAFIAGAWACALFSCGIIAAAVLYNWMFYLCIPILWIFPFLCAVPPDKKTYGGILPTKVTIDKEEGLTCEGDDFELYDDFKNVRKVIDYGEGYHILVSNNKVNFVCQKSLITQGTLEEFEELFKDVLVKETK